MNEKKPMESSENKSFSFWKWVKKNPLIFLLIIGALFYLLQSWRVKDHRKFFNFRENNGEIKIEGLEKEDLKNITELTNKDNIDEKAITWTPHFGKHYEYSLHAKNEEILKRISPVNYYTISDIKPEKIQQALKEGKINFDFSKTGNIVKLELRKEMNFLSTERRKLLPKIVEDIIIGLLVFLIIDLILGGRIISGLLSMTNLRKSNSKLVESPALNFKDIGGLHEAKEELQEIINYFNNPQAFQKRGAQVPKGILLVGQPGNGKTLLAKALAGECKLPFIYRSAPEFEKGIVGWGAMEVRNTFAAARNYAKEKKGCIIFVDEIDAIAGKRYQSIHSHHETLNQLLSELDGFSARENVIFLAATNSLNHLDPAILRPGRFDRRIFIPLPNFYSRKEIIKLCITKKNISFNIDLEEVTSMTDGLSGAQIVNIFNESVILSLRYKRDYVDQEIIFEAFDRTLMGPSLKNQNLTPKKKLLLAYHEAGHALVGLTLPETIVRKITITPRGNAGGYTWVTLRSQQDDSYLLNKSQILDQITSLLGGRVSEELFSGKEYVTIGAYSDFKRAFALTRDLVLLYGMSDLGIISAPGSPLFGEESLNELSEITRQKIEKETEKILKQCQEKAKKILQEKRIILDLLAQALVNKNTLQKEEINYIFINQKLPYIPLL